MLFRCLLGCFLFASVCFGQGLPDRDELVEKFKDAATTEQATRDLYKHFGMGGLRTIIRNINDLPLERRLRYGHMFGQMDLNRFRNDLNANVDKAEDSETRAMWLMLLARVGRSLDPSVFSKYADDETQDMRVRLAALSGICKVQDPKRFERFYTTAETAIVDPGSGRNDLAYADISKANRPFYYFTKSQLDKDKVSHGAILAALAMVDGTDTEIYESILDLRRKKYVPLLIDRAVQVGGVALFELMAKHKFTKKKFKNELMLGKAAAAKLAPYQSKLYGAITHDLKKFPLGPILPMVANGSGSEGYRSAFAVVKVAVDGTVSVVEHQRPFGGSDTIRELEGKTLPAHLGWEPMESYFMILSP